MSSVEHLDVIIVGAGISGIGAGRYLRAELHATLRTHLPRQGDRMPWLTSMDYQSDVKLLRTGDVAGPELHFGTVRAAG